ncbi:MAG: STM4014 family protein [Tannerellaceae bacterium]|jgi:glutathione synthase/RimK-type ligase-like ATP-grasp enzyme|nr:STM4014 family protein [Tannerellaceae bacterium]
MQALVVSNVASRRTAYFIKAGEYAGVDARFITYEDLEKNLSSYENVWIKLEPPWYHEAGFIAWHTQCMEYCRLLRRIGQWKKGETVRFLNEPEAIVHALDKVKSKEQLAGLRTTPLVASSVAGFDSLVDLLLKERCFNVFIKPRFGSGAGGILALRYNKRSGALAVYTTLARHHTFVYNTKRINRLTNPQEIAILINTIADTGLLIEEWIQKDSVEGENYDLRVVCQFGNVEHIVVRCSKGVITNLHLNNKARLYAELPLPQSIKEEINELSIRATQLSGLQYAGIDILIERDTQLPYLIEVNGQGDHLYQDIYSKNTIYKKQLLQLV